jgi:hypothetical protein
MKDTIGTKVVATAAAVLTTLFNWAILEPAPTGSLLGLVQAVKNDALRRFGKSGATIRSIRDDFHKCINRVRTRVNKTRAEGKLAKLTQYDVIIALATNDPDGLGVSFSFDDLFAFGRRIANTVGYENPLIVSEIKDVLDFCTVDYVESDGASEYVTMSDLTVSTPHEAPTLPAGETVETTHPANVETNTETAPAQAPAAM